MTDQTYRPVPTFADRLAQDDRDQLDARAATAEQERDDALDDLTETRRKLAMVIAERDERLTLAESSRLAKRYDEAEEARDCARQVATFRQGVIDQYRQELGAAGEVLAVVRDAAERIDRALAQYDTQPEVTPVEADDDADEPDDLRSPLAAERDQLVETIGRLVSLPPEQIAQMHKVGYSGMSAGLGSPSPRAQELPGWVLELVRGLDRYEVEHPKLFRYIRPGVYEPWDCPGPLLALVPAEVLRLVELPAQVGKTAEKAEG